MFGPLGFQEVLFILVLALLIIGPRKLPQVARTIGRTLSEFRKASTELKRSINAEIADEELRQSDPRKLVRETFDEVKSLGADLTAPLKESGSKESESKESEVGKDPAPAKEPAAVKPGPEGSGMPDPGTPDGGTPDRAGAVSRGSIPADEPDSEPSRS